MTWEASVPDTHPMNYFVPNFGVDHDIASTQQNENDAAKTLGVSWEPKYNKKKEKFTDMPQVKEDFMKVQLESQISSDPICGTGGCTQYKHGLEKEKPYPMNYKV